MLAYRRIVSDVNDGFSCHITATSTPCLARDNIPRAKGWIDTCVSHHRQCRDFQSNNGASRERPTRVLQLTSSSVKLRCDMTNGQFDYLVLSHIWGSVHDQQLKLLSKNLTAFQTSIPYARLSESAIYVEAIRITRLLGYQYLWVDSLCIIQDSPKDWEYEASRMAIVYGNAVCNIASLFPAQDVNVVKKSREPRDWNPCILRKATPRADGIHLEHGARGRVLSDERYGMGWLMQEKWALFDRAWTFQEYLLAPRTILVGHENLMFQCSQGFYDELLGPIDGVVEEKVKIKNLAVELGKSKYFPETLGVMAKAKAKSPSNLVVLSFMHTWLKIQNEYRARRLSHATDRIVAFAGLARAYSHMGSMTYLAGAWRECLPLSLLWHVGEKSHSVARAHNNIPVGVLFDCTVEVQEHTAQPAPSFSWFSVHIYAFHELKLLLDDEDISALRKSVLDSPFVHFNDIHWADAVSFQFDSHDANIFPVKTGFSEFANLRVTLSMPMLPVRVNWPVDLIAQMKTIKTQSACADDLDFDFLPVFTYYHDDIKNNIENPPRNGILALVAEYQITRTGGKYAVQRFLVGLVLIPGLNQGEWKRVGAWKLKLRISGIVVMGTTLAAVAQRWRGYKIVSDKWIRGDVVIT